MKKTIIILASISVAAILILCTCLLFSPNDDVLLESFIDAFGPPTSANKMRRIFNRDKEELSTVVNFLIDSGYTEINISSSFDTSNKMYAGLEIGNVEIEDESATEAIHYLLAKQGYDYIKRNDNTIFFKNGLLFAIIHVGLLILLTEKISRKYNFLQE